MVSCLVELSFHAAEGLSTRQEHVHGKQHLHPGKRDKFNQNFLKNLCHGWIVLFFFFLIIQQLLDEVKQNIAICQRRADQLFAEAES